MRIASHLVPFITVAGLACAGSTTAPSGGLDGSWRTAPIPSGAGVGMTLTTSGSVVTGTGAEAGLMGKHVASITVLGHSAGLTFSLTLTYDNGTVAKYSARFVGPDELSGTWTIGAESTPTFVFYRQPT